MSLQSVCEFMPLKRVGRVPIVGVEIELPLQAVSRLLCPLAGWRVASRRRVAGCSWRKVHLISWHTRAYNLAVRKK